ncbi:MAG: class I SAM-dependent methyltransferase [Gemmatimonadales bacterium]|nr:class I SAM-dependent methyltransferase [Gemmatimonadales bacterium]
MTSSSAHSSGHSCDGRDSWQRILASEHPPRQQGGDRQLPWHNPEFSSRMLDVHLDPTTHMASRAPEIISRHVTWLEEQLNVTTDLVRPADGFRILDVGCGPGLYCHEQAKRGMPSTGFDFAPAPLAWAEETAITEKLDCNFLTTDLTHLPDDFAEQVGPQEAITFWFGEFHSFTAEQVADFLPRLAQCLVPGGLFILEYQPWDLFVQEDSNDWSCHEKSVFSDEPHLWLQEFGWDPDTNTEVHVHWILTEKSGTLQRYVQCHQGWTDEELVSMLAAARLESAVFHPPITGVSEEFEFPVLVTRRLKR